MNKKLRITLLILAGVLFVWSLFLPAVITEPAAPGMTGMFLLLVGAFGPGLASVFAWYANPLAIAALILAKTSRITLSRIFSGIAVVVALQTCTLKEIIINEAGHTAAIDHLGPGFYCWFASIFVVFAWCCLRRTPNKPANSL